MRASIKMAGKKGRLSLVAYGPTAEADVKAIEEAMNRIGLTKLSPTADEQKTLRRWMKRKPAPASPNKEGKGEINPEYITLAKERLSVYLGNQRLIMPPPSTAPEEERG